MKELVLRPTSWRALSSLLLVAFIVALLITWPVPQWGWIALIGSGVAFAVELLLARRGAPARADD